MRVNRIYWLMAVCLLAVWTMTACVNKTDEADNKQQGQETSQQQVAKQNQRPDWKESFDQISFADLTIGQKVMVMGSEDENKLMTARQIFVGDREIDFEQIGRGIFDSGVDVAQQAGSNNEQRPQPDSGEQRRPPADFERFQNISEEEREKLRQEMMARRGESGGNMTRTRNGGRGMARIVGEVLSKDETSLTVKVEKGGSKLVFVSDETMVLKAKQQAE